MVDIRITITGLWAALMLTFLLGDVLRIFAGDFTQGQIAGRAATQGTWLLIAAIMVTPVLMMVASLVLPYPAIRWTCLGAAGLWVVFNLAGLPYKGAYDNFLIGVSFVLCALIAWYAWTWPATA